MNSNLKLLCNTAYTQTNLQTGQAEHAIHQLQGNCYQINFCDDVNVLFEHSSGPVSGVVGLNRRKRAQYLPINYKTALIREILRMILRSLGRYYEHQRPDRYHYISIKWRNIAQGMHRINTLQFHC